MKLTKLSNLIMLGLALTFVSAGCKKRPTGVTNLPGQGRTRPGDTAGMNGLDQGNGIKPFDPSMVKDGGLAPNAAGSHDGWKNDPDALKAQTVYFDFDKSAVKSSEQPKLDEVANYLRSNPNAAVRVEGNCDERGTEEYNRSLGERRALAAREVLVRLGVDPSRVDTVTYGEDKPAVPGHDESAWSKNRRDDFIVLTPP
jgi:peptidoglycan-associated lipoprotein